MTDAEKPETETINLFKSSSEGSSVTIPGIVLAALLRQVGGRISFDRYDLDRTKTGNLIAYQNFEKNTITLELKEDD